MLGGGIDAATLVAALGAGPIHTIGANHRGEPFYFGFPRYVRSLDTGRLSHRANHLGLPLTRIG